MTDKFFIRHNLFILNTQELRKLLLKYLYSMKLNFSIFIILIVISYTINIVAQENQIILNKTMDDDSRYTNIGNIGLTVTNFGMYGNGFALWSNQPSCEYPLRSGIEHIIDGSLWVGGFVSSDSFGSSRLGPFVSTRSVDALSVSTRGGGFEFTNAPGSKIIEMSSLLDSRCYDPYAISHQDFFKFTPFGDELQSFGGIDVFNGPYAVAYFDNILYVADTGNNRILRFILSTEIQ